MHRRVLVVAVGALVLLTTACAGPGPVDDGDAVSPLPGTSSGAASSAVSTSAVPSGSAAPSAVSAPASASRPAPTASPTRGGTSSGAVAACQPEAVDVTLAGREASAGHLDYRFAFTNRGSRPCTLSGPPGVAFRGLDGSQAGQDAAPTARSGPVVRLAPGASASATASVVNVGTDGGPLAGRCEPVQGVGFFVDLPQTAGLKQVAADVRGCADFDTPFMTVTPITAV